MAFSETFGFGNSTFDHLESQVKRAIDGKEKNEQKKDEIDVILESPKDENLTRNRTRLFTNSKNETNKRNWRRSKSDSKLLGSEAKDTSKNEHYTQFFESDFAISLQEQGANETANKPKPQEESMMRVSQLEAVLDDNVEDNDELDGGFVSAWEVPIICSEDIKSLIETEDKPQEDTSAMGLQFSSSFELDNLNDKRVEAAVETKPNNDPKTATEFKDIEELPPLDATCFMCPAENEVAKTNLENALEASRLEIRQDTTFLLEAPKSHELSKRITPASEVLNATAQRSPEHKAPVKDLESLKLISAWGLPLNVLAEYEKKGIMKMFDWQIECLSNPNVLFEHCNLVYSAPTSAGKTLVSEILLLKTVLERGKKVLMILPFISVVREKMFYLQDLLTPAGYRVEGFFGGYTPPGGFDSIHVAICTIEKANSIVNKLLEQNKLECIGTVVVDEVHLISDPGRGYILELLLAKILYMSRKYGLRIQIITMSATLANVELLKRWLDAELFLTNYRPVALEEMIKVGTKIFDAKMSFLRDLAKPENEAAVPIINNDTDNVAQLCLETVLEGCSVIIFCPSKDWCEKLSIQLAGVIHGIGKSGSDLGLRLRKQLKREAINEVKRQLRDIPTGLDTVLEKTITYGCAFHHAGLTTEERDIVESSFKTGALKIIVATSTLSSGVNLPARRVLIRTPLFGGKQMSSLTYKQMIGRAGRTGKDTLGESILICTDANARTGRELITAELKPITSCLELDSSTHLKRALLEVISSGVANTKSDIELFVNCTLLSAQKLCNQQEKDTSSEGETDFIAAALAFLMEYEFLRLQNDAESGQEHYIATRLGLACLASSMPPTDGLILFTELQKSRRCFVLESELHAVYLVTPYSVCYQMQDMDWLFFLDLWEKLTPAMKKVGELVGVKESFLVRAMRGQTKLDYKLMQVHKRFYTALALQELVNETPINRVAQKYKCTRGLLQSLQQMAATFAGIVTAFCNALQWNTLSLIVSQFKERLFFGIHRDLIDLMRLPNLSHKRARAFFDAGIKTLIELANADVLTIEKVLHNSLSFDSAKQHENENAYEMEQRQKERNFYITGKTGLTVAEAAKLLIDEARQFVEYEVGAVGSIKWTQEQLVQQQPEEVVELHMSCEENDIRNEPKKRKSDECNSQETPAKMTKLNEKDKGAEKGRIEIENVKTSSTLEIVKPAPARVDNCSETERNSEPVPKKEIKRAKNEDEKPKEIRDNIDSLFNDDFDIELVKETFAAQKPAVEKCIKTLNNKKELPGCSKNNKNVVSMSNGSDALKAAFDSIKAKRPTSPQKHGNVAQAEKTTKQAASKIANVEQPSTSIAFTNTKPKKEKENSQQIGATKQTNFKPSKAVLSNSIKTTPKSEQKANALSKLTEQPPRRSPRNHAANNQKKSNETKSSNFNDSEAEDLFANEDSFEMNSGLFAALAMAEEKPQTKEKTPPPPADEIPSSQNITSNKTPKDGTPVTPRLLRSYRTQRVPSPLTVPKQEENAIEKASVSSNVDFSLDSNSTLDDSPYVMQMNASHILSCSKEATNALGKASSFSAVEIVDMCGNLELFKLAFQEILSAKRLGFCLGLQQLANTAKKKPLIGANLLINQIHAAETNSNEAELTFRIDDSFFIAGVAFCINENVVFFMNLQTAAEFPSDVKISSALKRKCLQKIFHNAEKTLIIYEARKQLKLLLQAVPQFGDIKAQFEDPKVANWLLQPDQRLSLRHLAQQYAPECSALVNLCGGGRGDKSHGIDASSAISPKIRCSIEACVIVHILQGQSENLERIGAGELKKFFHELEMPIQLSLCKMESIGFPANEKALRDLFQKMLDTSKQLEAKIFSLHGKRFNLGSAQAVGKVLGLCRKSNGRVSTSRQVLEKIDDPLAQLIIAYRKLSVIMSKNIQPLLLCVHNNRIHGQSDSFTATGRISMKEPNLQNVAKDFDIDYGLEKISICCRHAFFPTDLNRCLVSADFCQLEMRVLAHMSKDPELLKTMQSPNDVFTAIAAGWNSINETEVSEQLRNGTKQICYGIIYGMGMRALAESLKCSEDEAKQVSEQFHEAYPAIRVFTRKIIDFARRNGYVETIQGRKRYLENINSTLSNLRSQAERQAVNSAIQGSAADIAKRAILRTEKSIFKYAPKLGLAPNDVHFVLHVHDELIFEVPTTKAKKIAKVINLTMETCTKLEVPLKVKLKMGRSWGEMKEVNF